MPKRSKLFKTQQDQELSLPRRGWEVPERFASIDEDV